MAMRSAYGQSQSGVEAVAVIERLKQRLKDDDVSPTDSTVAELRHAAQELLADTLMGDIQSASSGLLDKHLWQHGFYNHMVLFRQRLKRFDAEAAKGSASAVSELAATRLGLKSFLHAGIGFYTALIHGVCERYRLVLPGLAVGGLLGVQSTSLGGNHGQASAVDQRYATATCQRALLYLGDLSRYLQLYCVSNPRWSGVKGYVSPVAENVAQKFGIHRLILHSAPLSPTLTHSRHLLVRPRDPAVSSLLYHSSPSYLGTTRKPWLCSRSLDPPMDSWQSWHLSSGPTLMLPTTTRGRLLPSHPLPLPPRTWFGCTPSCSRKAAIRSTWSSQEGSGSGGDCIMRACRVSSWCTPKSSAGPRASR
eukprot:m.341939 g.341939  ORF g.341939 m.341939 type:complete len:364 (-) comp27844_c0_seq3:2329-3420(-)